MPQCSIMSRVLNLAIHYVTDGKKVLVIIRAKDQERAHSEKILKDT